MGDPVRVVVLCEDEQHACFVRRFLAERGFPRRELHFEKCTRGCGEQFVRKKFPEELKAYRAKCNHLRNGLIVAIDADTGDVEDRLRALNLACDEKHLERKKHDERVFFVIPKRNIETWLAYLKGDTVDEEHEYPKYACQSDCQPQTERLDRMCRDGELEGTPPPSLERCCVGFQEFWRAVE